MKEWTKEERYRILKDPDELKTLYEETIQSKYRQHYHIQPVTGLLNDPNGFVWHDHMWHLFYQWFPFGAVHGLKHWYHLTSPDLINWTKCGACVYPDTEFDNKGAYSGSALPKDDSIYLYYTGNHRDEDWTRIPYTCLSQLMDDGTAKKFDTPLFGPSPDYTDNQRDPKILYDEATSKYYILLGAETKDKKGRVIVYESEEQNSGWHFRGELKVDGYEDFGNMWECPSIERIGDKDILIFCPQHLKLPGRGDTVHHNGYLIGSVDFETLTFTHDGQFHVLDFGFDSYAAECAANIQDRNKAILIAWMGLPDASYPTDEDNWSGCLTLPRELTIRGRRLIQKPIPELISLRESEADASEGHLPDACEMEIFFDENNENGSSTGGKAFDFKLFTKPDGSGGMDIHYDDTTGEIYVDRSGMTKRFNTEQGERRARHLENELNHIRIFIDSSSVEIFVNDGDAVFTSRVFPTEEEHGFETDCTSCKLSIYKLKTAFKEEFVI